MSKQDILDFWFKETITEQWFRKDEAFDAKIRARFEPVIEAGLAGRLDDWRSDDDGALAFVLLMDQFTRNIYRDTPRAFAGDPLALATTLECIANGYLARNEQNHRYFMLMPMMHSEDLAIQDASLPLFRQHAPENAYDYAVKHRDIIAHFGRFPHRNAILGRLSTDEEVQFLTQPGSSF